MPWGLKRYQPAGRLHFITFSCYHRWPLLGTPGERDCFVKALEDCRGWYGFCVVGYVVMPGEEGVVEIESHWTGRKRERMGIHPRLKRSEPA